MSQHTLAAYLGLALVVALMVGASGWQGYRMGRDRVRADWNAQMAALEAARDAEGARLERQAREVVTVYLPKVEYIRAEERTVTKEVPVYVTREDDHRCGDLPDGFERLHDTAALGSAGLPAAGGAGGAAGASGEAAAAALVLSDVGRALVANYSACRRTAERLTALQALVAGKAGQP